MDSEESGRQRPQRVVRLRFADDDEYTFTQADEGRQQESTEPPKRQRHVETYDWAERLSRRVSAISSQNPYDVYAAQEEVPAPTPRRERDYLSKLVMVEHPRQQSKEDSKATPDDAEETERVKDNPDVERVKAREPVPVRYTESPLPFEETEDASKRPRLRQYSSDRRNRQDSQRSRSPTPPPPPPPRRYEGRGRGTYDESPSDLSRGYERSTYHRRRDTIHEDLDMYEKFSFAVSTARSSTEGDASDLETPSTDIESSRNVDNAGSKASSVPGIHSSHYSGAAQLGGPHKANLTVLHDAKGQKRPLFRWLHIRQEVMNFNEFWAEVLRQMRFSDLERNAIARLRAEVSQFSIKSRYNLKGVKVGYMDPRFIQIPLKPSSTKLDDDSTPSGTISWICLPYFSLQQYTGLGSASDTKSFPIQTLLQSQYSRITQQRDMEQVVCQLGMAPRGECFHIAQLWCLVLENSVLVTCGQMYQKDLQGENVAVNPEPARELSISSGSGKIIVSYKGGVVWVFATKECPTWFAFLSCFNEFWPTGTNIEFKHGSRVVTPAYWETVLKVAEGPRASITLKLDTPPDMDISERLRTSKQPQDEEKSGLHATWGGSVQTQEKLHVLALPPKGQNYSSSDVALKNLDEQLTAAEKFMTEKTSFSTQKGYKNCGLVRREEVSAHLSLLAAAAEKLEDDQVRSHYETQTKLFNVADTVYQTFLPASFKGPTSATFWGAVDTLIRAPLSENTTEKYQQEVQRRMLTSFTDALTLLADKCIGFQDFMMYASKEDRERIVLPQELVTAWLHILSGLIHSRDDYNGSRFLARAFTLITTGMGKIIHGICNTSLLEKAAMLPMEIVPLIALSLLQDQVGKSDDIVETYSQYLNSLDTDITTKPSERSYQHRIDFVQQEMTAIKRNITRQRRIISMLSTKCGGVANVYHRSMANPFTPRVRSARYDEHDVYGGRKANMCDEWDDPYAGEFDAVSKLSATDADGFRGLFLTECIRSIEQREYEFKRLTEYAEDLEREISYRMEQTKDRQENATYAFTIVTIIFLPLSAISSIFGMNTSDVRDMKYGQWLYWSVALPITFFVIVAGLWWMNELGNVFEWVSGKRVAPQYTTRIPDMSVVTVKTNEVAVAGDSDSEYGVRTTRRSHPALSRPAHRANVHAYPPPAYPPPPTRLSRRRRDSYYRY